MKKILVLVVALMMTASVSFAAVPGTGMYLGIGGGVDVPVSPSGGQMGFGGNVVGGYTFDKNMALQLDVDVFFTSQTGFSTVSVRPIAEVKYKFDSPGVSPYIFGGLGLNWMQTSFTILGISVSGSASNVAAAAGVGAEFDLGGGPNLFVQAKGLFTFASGTTPINVPIQAGLLFPLM